MNRPVAVRLHHPTLRNCVLIVLDESVVYPVPFECWVCKQTHIFKAFHLVLNEHGDVCVTPEIYERFRLNGIAPELDATKEVTPTPTVLALGAPPYRGPVVSERQGLVAIENHSTLQRERLSMNGGR